MFKYNFDGYKELIGELTDYVKAFLEVAKATGNKQMIETVEGHLKDLETMIWWED